MRHLYQALLLTAILSSAIFGATPEAFVVVSSELPNLARFSVFIPPESVENHSYKIVTDHGDKGPAIPCGKKGEFKAITSLYRDDTAALTLILSNSSGVISTIKTATAKRPKSFIREISTSTIPIFLGLLAFMLQQVLLASMRRREAEAVLRRGILDTIAEMKRLVNAGKLIDTPKWLSSEDLIEHTDAAHNMAVFIIRNKLQQIVDNLRSGATKIDTIQKLDEIKLKIEDGYYSSRAARKLAKLD